MDGEAGVGRHVGSWRSFCGVADPEVSPRARGNGRPGGAELTSGRRQERCRAATARSPGAKCGRAGAGG